MKKIVFTFFFAFSFFLFFNNKSFALDYLKIGSYDVGETYQRDFLIDVSEYPSDYYCLLRSPNSYNSSLWQYDLAYWDSNLNKFNIVYSAPCIYQFIDGHYDYGTFYRPMGSNLSPILDIYDTLPSSIDTVDIGLGYDITLSHSEFNYPLVDTFWEFISVKNAWNYPNVSSLLFEIYVNGEKIDTITKANNFSTNFGVAFDFFTSFYHVSVGDTIRVLCIPRGDNVKGLPRGIEWIVGSIENVTISKIPNTTPIVKIDNVPYVPTIQNEKQFIYNPTTNEYVTNNYYTQNYESPDFSNIESQLDYIISYIENNPISSGADTPQTIINYNTTNQNYNFNFGDISFGDIDIDLEIGNAKEHVKRSFDDFITNIQLLMDSPFEKVVVAFGAGIGLLLIILAIVIVAKILDIIIP